MLALPLLAAVALSTPARADSPWVLQAGVGVGVHRTRYHADYIGPGVMRPAALTSVGPGVRLDAGYRVHPVAAVGVHLGGQHVRAAERLAIDQYEDEHYLELEAGLSAAVVLDRVSMSPWFGQQGFQSKRQYAGGMTVAYDVRVGGSDRVAAFASATYGTGFEMRYYGLCLGVAYRYW